MGQVADPILSILTDDERLVLLAGLATGPQRDAVWTALGPEVGHLGRLGLVKFAEQRNAGGGELLVSLPLHLTDYGVRLARELSA